MEPILIVAVLAVATFFVVKARAKKCPHSKEKMLRFANTSATEVLSSNWDHEEYYGLMYKYASIELASHMFKNKSLLNKVLDERNELLGSFKEIKDLELKGQGFRLWPSHVYEVSGVLQGSKASVPIIVLVNASKEDLSLDGIKILKKEAKAAKQ